MAKKTIISTDSTFTPGEAEKITGVSTTLQRDWRRRGIIPANGNGWTQHSPRDLARLLFLQVMARMGRDPAGNVQYSEVASTRILFFALRHSDAVENNTGQDFGDLIRWTESGGPHRYFVIGASERSTYFVDDANWPFNQEYPIFAARIVDLQALGSFLATQPGRPLVTINFEQDGAYEERLKKMPMLDRKARKARGDAERAKWAAAMKPVKPKPKGKRK